LDFVRLSQVACQLPEGGGTAIFSTCMCDPFYSRYAQTEELTSQVEDNHATRLLALISCVPHSATGKLEGAAWDDLIATCFKAINTGCEGNGDNVLFEGGIEKHLPSFKPILKTIVAKEIRTTSKVYSSVLFTSMRASKLG
jgi:hypothetical protein